MMSTERKRVRIARHRASERSLCSSSRERTAVKRIFVCGVGGAWGQGGTGGRASVMQGASGEGRGVGGSRGNGGAAGEVPGHDARGWHRSRKCLGSVSEVSRKCLGSVACWMSVKDEAEMRSSATKERRFIPRKMSAGTCGGGGNGRDGDGSRRRRRLGRRRWQWRQWRRRRRCGGSGGGELACRGTPQPPALAPQPVRAAARLLVGRRAEGRERARARRTAIFADVRTSLRLVSANQRGPRFALSWRRASPGSSGDSRRIISHEKHSLSTSPTARIDCADASSCSTPDE